MFGPLTVVECVLLLGAGGDGAAVSKTPMFPPPKALLAKWHWESREDMPADKLLESLAKSWNLTIDVDRAGLEKAVGRKLNACFVRATRNVLPRGVFLEEIANQIGGTVGWVGQRVIVAPGRPQSYVRFFTPSPVPEQPKLSQLADVRTVIANAPLEDVLAFFGDKFDLVFAIDDGGYAAQGIKRVGTQAVQLPAGTKTVRSWLDGVAAQVGGEVRVFEEAILIVPRTKTKR